jgi:hypothetical protein
MKEKWFDEWWVQYGADKPLWGEDPQQGKSGNRGPLDNGFGYVCNCSKCESLGLDATGTRTRPRTETLTKTHMSDEMVYALDAILDEMDEVLRSKYADYGPNNILSTPGGPLQGIAVRLYDKVARLDNLTKTGNAPQNESIHDTLIDIANYAVIAMMVQDGEWGK